MLVEEVPKSNNSGTSTVYFTSSINLTARSNAFSRQNQLLLDAIDGDAGENGDANKGRLKIRGKVNYNLNDLMNAQTQTTTNINRNSPLKSSQQLQLEKIVSRRLVDLNKETTHSSFELPKNFNYQSIHFSSSNDPNKKKSRLGNTPTTKKILAARRNLNSYFEEERNLISINSILSVNFQFIEQNESETQASKKAKSNNQPNSVIFKPRLKLCCVCGLNSNYTRCVNCGLFYCSVRCNRLHQELRCI